MLLSVAATLTVCPSVYSSPAAAVGGSVGIADVNASLAEFDQVRALAMRGLRQAQDLKTAHLYGRGFGLDLSEARAEDMLVEGQWLLEYLHAMDVTSISLLSYATADQHPNLSQELALFRSCLPQAAARTLAYYDRTAAALATAREQVNAAGRQQAPMELVALKASAAGPRAGAAAAVGEGFRLGWGMPVCPRGRFSDYQDILGQSNDMMVRRAQEAGLDFIAAWDVNTFDWASVEKQPGQYDWSRLDEVCKRLATAKLGLWLIVPSAQASPPEWMIADLGNKAVLLDPNGKRIQNQGLGGDSHHFGVRDEQPVKYPINLFEPKVREGFTRFLQAMLARVHQHGTQVVMVDLVGNLPVYGGDDATARWRVWIKTTGVDPRQRWGAGFDAADAPMPVEYFGVQVGQRRPANLSDADAGTRRMLVDFSRWREQEYIDYMRPQVQAIRAADAALPISIGPSDDGEANESLSGRDSERLCRELNVLPGGFSQENIWDNLRRCFSPAGYSMAVTHSGSGDAYSQYAFSGYVHETLGLYSLPELRGGTWGDLIIYPDYRFPWTALLGWRRFQERAAGMAPEVLATRPAAQVAMLWSDTSAKYQAFIKDWAGGTYGFGIGPANYNKIGCVGWNRLLDSMNLSQDMITERQILEGGLSRYQLLVMPSVQALPADVAEKIRQFVSAGGSVVATSAPAVAGDDMELKPHGQLADVFGADFAEFLPPTLVANTPMTAPVIDSSSSVWGPNGNRAFSKTDLLRTLYCTFAPRPGGQVIESFTTGQPAVILNSFGQGKAMVIGYPIGRESFLSDVYHQHYGNNWPNLPHGSRMQQGLCNWLELQLPKLGMLKEAAIVEEIAARSVALDSSWPSHNWPRAMPYYRDWLWTTARQDNSSAPPQNYGLAYGSRPRSVETIVRKADDNPTTYVTVFNREGSYGFDPGAAEFESSSKQVWLELARADVKAVYDLSLGCPVPFEVKSLGNRKVTSLATMIEPSCARMLAVSADGKVNRYEGARTRGGWTDEQLRANTKKLAAVQASGADQITLDEAVVLDFLRNRSGKEVIISAEAPEYLSAAERLAEALGKALGKPARISRNSPRIVSSQQPLWDAGRQFLKLEETDIVLGNRDTSATIAQYAVHTGWSGHTLRLPVMVSASFPGAGQSIIELTRPYIKDWTPGQWPADPPAPKDPAAPKPAPVPLVKEKPMPPQLVVAASDLKGVQAGVERLIQLVGKSSDRRKQNDGK